MHRTIGAVAELERTQLLRASEDLEKARYLSFPINLMCSVSASAKNGPFWNCPFWNNTF
jgi:hypothetical protein